MEINITYNASDFSRLNQNLNRLADETGKTLKEVLPAQMRLLASDLAYVTYPKGKGSRDNEIHMKKIIARIRDVYPPPGFIVNKLKEENQGAAGKFAGFITSRKIGEAQKILNHYLPAWNIRIGAFDGGELHGSQANSKKVKQRLLVIGYTRVEAYAKKTARKSGFAKGGFATAARQLGGVRGIPGFATRQKAPGTGVVTGDGKTLTVTMTNGVSYIEYALLPHDESAAVNHRAKVIEKLLKRIQDRKVRKAMSNFR